MAHRRHGFIKTLLSLVLVVLLVELGFCGWSGFQIKNKSEALNASFSSYEAQLENEDYEGALSSLRQAAASAQEINQELSGWQWQVAAKVPVLGDDVSCAQQAAGIGDALAAQALLPVLQEAENLFSEATSSDLLGAIAEKVEQTDSLMNAITSARTVVSSCREKVQTLPTSHFDELNKAVAELRQVITQADDNFNELSDAIDVANSVTDFASSLI